MEGGSGKDSYAQNSLLQSHNFHTFGKPHLSRALDHFADLFFLHYVRPRIPAGQLALAAQPSCEEHTENEPANARFDDEVVRLTVADFGCSYGQNTLDYAAFIIQGLHHRLKAHLAPSYQQPRGEEAPPVEVEMQYCFSDLPSNNFNALLQSLQPFLQEQRQCLDEGAAAPVLKWKLFTAAAAGSFHGRVFPARSLHLAISAYSVQWLSQVPCEVVDRSSPAWNGGHIWFHGTRPKVVEAYARQFQKDIKSFLLTRAEELVNGGILFLFFPCRAQKHPEGAFFTPKHDIWTGCYESTWEVMVLEGLITEEERDMFNLPFYVCHKSEMLDALNDLANLFKILHLDVMVECSNLPSQEEQKIKGDAQLFGMFAANFIATLMKPTMQEHLGASRTSMLLERLQIEATKTAHLSTSISYDMLVATIQRI